MGGIGTRAGMGGDEFYQRLQSNKSMIMVNLTPFSSRAIDRGVQGMMVGLTRLEIDQLSRESQARDFGESAKHNHDRTTSIRWEDRILP